MTEPTTYPTITEAETAIIVAGYVRDAVRHVWVQPGTGKTAKVVRVSKGAEENNSRFSVQWG